MKTIGEILTLAAVVCAALLLNSAPSFAQGVTVGNDDSNDPLFFRLKVTQAIPHRQTDSMTLLGSGFTAELECDPQAGVLRVMKTNPSLYYGPGPGGTWEVGNFSMVEIHQWVSRDDDSARCHRFASMISQALAQGQTPSVVLNTRKLYIVGVRSH